MLHSAYEAPAAHGFIASTNRALLVAKRADSTEGGTAESVEERAITRWLGAGAGR